MAPLEADDIWHPEFLAETVAALDARPEAPFAFTYSFRIDEEDRLFPFRHPKRPLRHDPIGQIWLNTVGSGSAGVYRKALMERVGGYDESMRRRGVQGAEDWKLHPARAVRPARARRAAPWATVCSRTACPRPTPGGSSTRSSLCSRTSAPRCRRSTRATSPTAAR